MSTVAGNEMLVLDAARRYPQAAFFGLNPGIIRTEIRDNFFGKGSWKSRVIESLIGLVTPSPQAYAARIAPLLLDPQIDALSGSMSIERESPSHHPVRSHRSTRKDS